MAGVSTTMIVLLLVGYVVLIGITIWVVMTPQIWKWVRFTTVIILMLYAAGVPVAVVMGWMPEDFWRYLKWIPPFAI
jgi:hypothetical protein